MPALPGARPAAGPGAAADDTAAQIDLLSGVSCRRVANCLAVGQQAPVGTGETNVPLAYHLAGRTWKAAPITLPAGSTAAGLSGVSCKPGGCFAVGFYSKGNADLPLAEHWADGKLVSGAQPQVPQGGSISNLQSVSCAGPKSCVAVGFSAASPTSQSPLAEVFDGSSWTAFTPPAPPTPVAVLSSVSCPTRTYCLAVGSYQASNGFTVLADSWNGKRWKQVPVPPASATAQNIFDSVSCTAPARCVGVGTIIQIAGASVAQIGFGDVLSGTTWTTSEPAWPAGGTGGLFAVSCVAETNCLATGGAGPLLTSTDGQAAGVVWNGSAWGAPTVATPPAGQGSSFIGVTCVTASYCVGVGAIGPFDSTTFQALAAVWNGRRWKQAVLG
jgi:hypothetical protein